MHRKITALFGKKKVLLRHTTRAITPFGGLCVFAEFLRGIRFPELLRQHMPVILRSPNAIAPAETLLAFLLAVVVGARRFSHASLLRADQALHVLLGFSRFPTDDTMRNLFRRFTQGLVQQLFEPLWAASLLRLPEPAAGHALDLDSTVFQRYGQQEGARKGYNPRKPGRLSHHPLLAVLAEGPFILLGWLRSGNCSSARGAVEFLKEALARMGTRRVRVVRADAGFFDNELLVFLESRARSYIIVARLSGWVRRELLRNAAACDAWRALDEHYAVSEFSLQLHGWDRARRFVVVRERRREKSLGKRLFDLPDYTFRVFVTNGALPVEDVWREYNQRACIEQRIDELKHDLAADDFCMHSFYATEAAFCSILLLFNLLAEFQRAMGPAPYRRPATLRTQLFLCGAILGRAGHDAVLHMSAAWGGLQRRKQLLDKLLEYVAATSPKLEFVESS